MVVVLDIYVEFLIDTKTIQWSFIFLWQIRLFFHISPHKPLLNYVMQ
jgi:hypothetical protein